MNRWNSGGLWLEHQIVFGSQFLEQPLLGLQHLFFILFESLFYVGTAMYHQPPEHLCQLAGQRLIGHQSALAPFDATVEASQRLVDAAAHAASDHAEQPPGPVAPSFLAAPPLAALSAARCHPQPSRE